MEEQRKVITRPGEIIDFETEFTEYSLLKGVPARVGTVERIDYRTDVYEDGAVYEKYLNVYLPYCYDPADTERKYNVLYYQHGNTCDPELVNKPEYRRMLDCLFDKGLAEPCIIVYTTYYFDVMEDVKTRKTTGYVPAGDGGYDGVIPNFYKEYIKDIIPAVELKYNTFLSENSAEAIMASRDHRAFSGYSRGAVCTWYMLHNNFEYFRYFAPMSCMTTAGHTIRDQVSKEEVIDYITAPIKAHPELPFFIYASNGYPNDVRPMIEQMQYIPKESVFSYGQDPEKNNFYFSLSDYFHNDELSPFYFANSLQVLFK